LIEKGSRELATLQLQGACDALDQLPSDLSTRWSRWKLARLGLRLGERRAV
jgi:hypothetical protein